MSVKNNTFLIGIVALLILAMSAGAQSSDSSHNSRGKSSAELLRAYGIDLSEPSLLAALHSPSPRIRVLAAQQLQSGHSSGPIPNIKQALSEEKDPQARIGIAAALSGLNDSDGAKELQSMCLDTNLPIRFVVSATQTLQMLSTSTVACLPRVLRSLATPADIDYRYVVISLLPPISRDVPPEQLDNIVITIERFILNRNEQPSVRLAAGHALAKIADPTSAEILQKALSGEKDGTMRSSFQDDLAALSSRPPN